MLEEKTQELMVNMQAVLPLIVTNALSALGAIVILLIGLWLSGKADQLVVRVLSRTPHFDPTLKSFFGSLARYLILTVTLLAVLSQFGIQTTSLVAVIGAASLAVGLALQGTLSNLAAGIMLLIFRPFRVGHKVQGRRQPRHGQGAVAVLDRAGDRRQGADHRAEWRRLGPAVAQFQRLSSASTCRRGALPDGGGDRARAGDRKRSAPSSKPIR